jgi:hypothetical protein
LKLVTNATFSDDKSDENLWLIADGAGSDVRIRVNYRPKGVA